MTHTTHDKLEAVKRELSYRRRVYEKRVAENRMTKAHADYQISVFEAIEADYEKLEKGERLL
jgi:hypothetical protein